MAAQGYRVRSVSSLSEALRAPTHETHEVAEGLAVPGVGADHELGGFHQEGVHGP